MNNKNIHTKVSSSRKGSSSSSHYRINNIEPIATKFVSWEIPPLKKLEETRVYRLRVQIYKGEKLSREDKNWITEQVNNNTYFCSAIPVLGWRFDFSDILNKYLVKQYGQWNEYYAIDKTSLRKNLYGRIEQIVAL